MVYDPVNYTYNLVQNFRNCMNCHVQTAEATVHHLTALASQRNCKACHGGLINNFDDGHTIPTYQPSLVTPWPSGKPNGDNTLVNSAGTSPGNCNFCHNTSNGQPGQPMAAGMSVEPTWLRTADGGIVYASVYQNAETHHSTGLAINDSTRCSWCHDMAAPTGYAVRRCEDCHGIATLHNITRDTNGDGVKPGAELAGYSHTGAQADCWGCHGNNGVIMAAPGGGPGIPALYSLTSSSVRAGTTTPLTLEGINFTNYIENPMTGAFDILVGSTVQLKDSAGITSELTPTSITETSMTVTLPTTIAPGTYQITAKKGPSLGNPLSLAVTPSTSIASATCVRSTKTLTVTGTKFGEYLNATGSGTAVTMNGVKGTVISWTDTTITARFPSCPTRSTATVDTIFDAVSASVVRR